MNWIIKIFNGIFIVSLVGAVIASISSARIFRFFASPVLPSFIPTDPVNIVAILSVIGTIAVILIVFGLTKLVQHLSKEQYKWLLWIMLGLIVVIQLWFSFNFIDLGRSDRFFVRNQATALINGSQHWADYFYVYPNNVNFTLVQAGILKLLRGLKSPLIWQIFNVLNFLWEDTALLAGWYVLTQWKYYQPSAFIFLGMWGLSISTYLYALYDYTDLIALAIPLDIMALGIYAYQHSGVHRWLTIMMMNIVIGLGVALKSNLIVVIIAEIIVLVLLASNQQIQWWQTTKILASLLLTMIIIMQIFSAVAKHQGYVEDPNRALPTTSWIAMSWDPVLNGRYDDDDMNSVRSQPTKDLKKIVATDHLKSNLAYLGLQGIIEHLFKKTEVFFGNGDFDSLTQIHQWLKAPSWYMDNQINITIFLNIFSQSIYMSTLVGSLLLFIIQRQRNLAITLVGLIIVGLATFHIIFWETAGRYALPLMSLYLLLSAQAVAEFKYIRQPFPLHKTIIVLCSGGILTSGLLWYGKNQPVDTQKAPNQAVSQQFNGFYFLDTPMRLKIKPQQTVITRNIILGNADWVRLHLRASKQRVQITIMHNGYIIKRFIERTNQVNVIRFKSQQPPGKYKIMIKNLGEKPISSYTGYSYYNLNNGQLNKIPHHYLIVTYANGQPDPLKNNAD